MPDTLASLVDHGVGVGSYRLDAACRFEAVDSRASALLGLSERALRGREVWEAFPSLRAPLQAQYEAVLGGAGPRRFVFRHMPSGRWFAVAVEPLGSSRPPPGLLVRFAEVTAELDGVAAEIEAERLAATAEATGRLAHDINNILTVILGNAEFLEEQLAGRPDLLEAVRLITTAVERSAALTGRVLRFARHAPPGRAETALPPLLGRIAARLTAEAPAWPVRVACAPDLPPVLADGPEIEAALEELLANAREALPGGGPVRIGARPAPEGEAVLISVADDGLGMPQAVRQRCLEPFVATGGGLGLGLSAVHGFARAHGGALSVESAPGAGTVVVLRLPARARPAEVAPNAAAGTQILLVEDDPDGRAELTRLLGTLGYGVTAASSAEEALAALRREPPDLLLTDIVLPGGPDGTRLVEEARRLLPALPAVLISGYAARREPRESDPEGGRAPALLAKPVRRAALHQALRRALEGPGARAGHAG
jgi:hypothetical protein